MALERTVFAAAATWAVCAGGTQAFEFSDFHADEKKDGSGKDEKDDNEIKHGGLQKAGHGP